MNALVISGVYVLHPLDERYYHLEVPVYSTRTLACWLVPSTSATTVA